MTDYLQNRVRLLPDCIYLNLVIPDVLRLARPLRPPLKKRELLCNLDL